MITFSIVVADTAWFVTLIRDFIKLLREAHPDQVHSTAEFKMEEDGDDNA